MQPLADDKGSKLSLTMEGGPRTIISDPRRLRQILLQPRRVAHHRERRFRDVHLEPHAPLGEHIAVGLGGRFEGLPDSELPTQWLDAATGVRGMRLIKTFASSEDEGEESVHLSPARPGPQLARKLLYRVEELVPQGDDLRLRQPVLPRG